MTSYLVHEEAGNEGLTGNRAQTRASHPPNSYARGTHTARDVYRNSVCPPSRSMSSSADSARESSTSGGLSVRFTMITSKSDNLE